MFAELTAVPWADLALAVVAVLGGYLVLGLIGFGSALIIVPLLTWHWPLALIVPLVLLIDVPASLLHTGLNLRQVAWREIPRLAPTMLLGALLGASLVAHARSDWPLGLLGLYILGVGLRGFRHAAPPAQAPARWAWPAGLAMGLVESMFGSAGPVVVAWLSRRLPDPAVLRATLPMTIVILASLALGGAAINGQMNDALLWTAWLVLQPVALLGVVLGHRIARRVPAEGMRRLVYGLLVISGVAMLGRAAAAFGMPGG